MTSKLDVIKQRLAEYDAAKVDFKTLDIADDPEPRAYQDARYRLMAAGTQLEANAPDDLRVLLAVAEAAVAIDLQEVINLSSEPVHMEQLASLQQAVAKLTG